MCPKRQGDQDCAWTFDDILANPNNAQFVKKSIICVDHEQLFVHFRNTQSVINRCRYQSITQQYLKRCLIKDASNYKYMFQPIAAIIRFSSESMLVVLYRIGMFMSRWWDLNICDVCYMLLLRVTGGGYLWCALSWGVQPKYVCSLLSYVGLQLLFVHFRCLLLVGFCYSKRPPLVRKYLVNAWHIFVFQDPTLH